MCIRDRHSLGPGLGSVDAQLLTLLDGGDQLLTGLLGKGGDLGDGLADGLARSLGVRCCHCELLRSLEGARRRRYTRNVPIGYVSRVAATPCTFQASKEFTVATPNTQTTSETISETVTEIPALAQKSREQLISTVQQGQQLGIDAAQTWAEAVSVSYTHLTLPTILRV